MSRPILLSNGQLHVGLNMFGLVHDFYFPYVGLENHTSAKGLRHRVGIWVDGQYSWLDDGNWATSFQYHPARLIAKTIMTNTAIGVRLECDDFVDSEINAFIRNIQVTNLADTTRTIRVFLHQVFVISDSHSSDTVQYVPDVPALVHYKGRRTFVVNARHSDGRVFDQYSVGLFGLEGHEGTYRDAEDGQLSGNNVEHGRVDSVLGLELPLDSQDSGKVQYWIAAGTSHREAWKIDEQLRTAGVTHRLLLTSDWWAHWIKPTLAVAAKLPQPHREAFIDSALLIKAQTDKRGAVLASSDTTMLNYERDSYAYCWTRDAAYALWPLMRIGYTDELLRFFEFSRRVLHDGGYLGHKYQADGQLGPSWHPYRHKHGPDAPPIQTDETALVLFLFGQYYRLHRDTELLAEYYEMMVAPMANFLAGYVDDRGLPLPSYDLWEQKYLTTTYTTAVTYASLLEASFIAESFNAQDDALRWRTAAERMREHRDVFYNSSTTFFFKGYVVDGDTTIYDDTIDCSSLFGAFMFGFYDIGESQITDSYQTLLGTLITDGYAVVRYRDDDYHHSGADIANPWPVTSLWFAQYALEIDDTDRAMKILDWVHDRMGATHVLAEQYTPHDFTQRSVLPLTWSQAEYMSALLDLITEESDTI